MEKGKFSQPRPYRDEERQIEESFRQVMNQKSPARRPIKTNKEPAASMDQTTSLPTELLNPAPEFPAPQPVLPEEPIEDAIFREIENNYPDPEPAPSAPQKDPVPYPDIPEEDPELPEEDFPEESTAEALFAFFQKKGKWILTAIFAVALLLIVGVVSIFAAGSSDKMDEDRILNNVMLAGINVGGMTKDEAIRTVNQATARTYTHQNMVVNIAGTQILLSPQDTGAKLDVEAAVEAAYSYGRTGTQEQQEQAQADSLRGNHTVGLLPYLELDKAFIRLVLEATAGDSGSTLTQASYGLEGSYPSLSVPDFKPDSAQTLVLTMGTPGVSFDVDRVYDQILDAYSLHVFEVTVTDTRPAVEPDPVDLEAIYQEFYVAPVDDRINMQTFETIPGSYGYEFDLEAAQKLVDTAAYGQVIRIPMQFIEPEMLEDDVLFRDVMGEYQIKITGSSALAGNIRLACSAINGTVLQPGALFSFNEKVGEPTSGKGYEAVAEMVGNKEIYIVGGGISRAASALYCAALISDMEIVNRFNHEQSVDYTDLGLDAYVSWGSADLKFRNSSLYPVQIKASVSGSYVTVQILGTDSRDYFIQLDHSVTGVESPAKKYAEYAHDNPEGYKDGEVIEEGYSGYTVKTYKVKYSKDSGRKLSSDYETTSRYPGKDTLIAKVLPPEPTVPETTVTEPPTTEPPVTEPPATETTQPPEPEHQQTQPAETESAEQETQSAEITDDTSAQSDSSAAEDVVTE